MMFTKVCQLHGLTKPNNYLTLVCCFFIPHAVETIGDAYMVIYLFIFRAKINDPFSFLYRINSLIGTSFSKMHTIQKIKSKNVKLQIHP
jgi:hypothetical protein